MSAAGLRFNFQEKQGSRRVVNRTDLMTNSLNVGFHITDLS